MMGVDNLLITFYHLCRNEQNMYYLCTINNHTPIQSPMLHNEHLRKADELYEIRHDNKGNAIHIFIKDGEGVVYPTLHDLVLHQYFGRWDISERFYLSEQELNDLYESESYEYYTLKKTYRNGN